MDVRRLTESDGPLLDGLFARCTEFFQLVQGCAPAGGDGPSALEERPHDCAPELKHTFGLFQGDRLEGAIDMLLGFPEPTIWYIGLLIPAPSARGQGLGAEVVTALGRWAAAQGAEALRIAVVAHNTRGLAFWRRRGFEDLYTVENHEMGNLSNTVFVMGLGVAP